MALKRNLETVKDTISATAPTRTRVTTPMIPNWACTCSKKFAIAFIGHAQEPGSSLERQQLPMLSRGWSANTHERIIARLPGTTSLILPVRQERLQPLRRVPAALDLLWRQQPPLRFHGHGPPVPQGG